MGVGESLAIEAASVLGGALSSLHELLGAPQRTPPNRVAASTRCEIGESSACRSGRVRVSSARSDWSTFSRRSRVSPAARRGQGISRPDPDALRCTRSTLPDAVVYPASEDEVREHSRHLCRRGRRSRAVRWRHQCRWRRGADPRRLRGAGLARPRSHGLGSRVRRPAVRCWPSSAPAFAGPQVEEGARPLPASRSVTSRSRSSTRPSAVGWRPARPVRPRPATARIEEMVVGPTLGQHRRDPLS